jgi:hypothetical protein
MPALARLRDEAPTEAKQNGSHSAALKRAEVRLVAVFWQMLRPTENGLALN